MFPLALIAMFVPAIEKDKADYRFTLKKAEDTITARADRNRTVFVIKSKSGIGDGTIRLESGNWPTRVVLRFEYARGGDGFQMLESFSLTTDRIAVTGSKSMSGRMDLYFIGPDGKSKADAAGVLDVKVEIRAGAMEVTLPAYILTGAKEVKIDWIDAFRR